MLFFASTLLHTLLVLLRAERMNVGQIQCLNEFMVAIDYSNVVPTTLLPESSTQYGMEHYLGVQAPGLLVLCPSNAADKTTILKYNTAEIAEFLQTVFKFPPNIVVDTASWKECSPWDGDCLSVKMKNKQEKEPIKPVIPTYVPESRSLIAHGTNMHAVYSAVNKTHKQLLPKNKRLLQNVEFNMGAQQAIRDEWNDHYLSVVPMSTEWQATTFYWAHAVAHLWTWPRTASSSGILQESPKWGLPGAPKWATLDRDSNGNWIPAYSTDDQIPVVAAGICKETLVGKTANQGSGKVGNEMGCSAMVITEIFVAPSLKQDIEAVLQDALVVHSFDDLKNNS